MPDTLADQRSAAATPPANAPIAFDNSYSQLPERFYARLEPTPVPAPQLIRVNEPLARHLSIDPAALATADGVAMLAGNAVPPGAAPLAMAYAGHQFGNFVPQLGDGRALLLGEVIDRDGVRRDIQLKGSGRTPFSRRGDGRAVLGPVLREYIVAEAMAALGIPTTRALAMVTTGEEIWRETALPGAVLTRVARSHVRIGTFEFFAAREDVEAIRLLADHVIARLYPDIAKTAQPYRALFDTVIGRTAELVAGWQSIGFIHGVMNTDNMSIAGETIDYGPCAFMDTYHPGTVYSSIDSGGRYAYGNQPRIAHWNLMRLGVCLLPLLGDDEAQAVAAAQAALDTYPARFEAAWLARFRRKLGLAQPRDGDLALVQDLLNRMAENKADFTLMFRRLSDMAGIASAADDEARALFADPAAFDAWAATWRQRLAEEGSIDSQRHALMRAANPAFIPRNHLVEAAIVAAQTRGDFAVTDELLAVLASPYDDQPGRDRYAQPPKPDEVVHQTFCGT
ncbi:MAG TPA: YdiU family protein [Vineibacter sp.]|nr:YdiU family protein [Vineibacter sp.]